ncbi:MAG: alpha-glucuronidase family glycosyl hydrolase [Marinoscillum sp.]
MNRTINIKYLIKAVLTFFICFTFGLVKAERGYDLWLRYQPVNDPVLLKQIRLQVENYAVLSNSATGLVIREELGRGLSGLLSKEIESISSENSSLLVATPAQYSGIKKYFDDRELSALGSEGFAIKSVSSKTPRTIITANSDIGLLYGAFHLLKLIQTNQSLEKLNITSVPKIDLRVLNHWDNLDRTSERGYAGFSIWDWHKLPDYLNPRYTDYARANASIGINGTVLTNVNANALVLTPHYLEKVKALADLFRPYGIKVYLTARFSAPIEIGGLKTADPLDAEVLKWWMEKVTEIYEYVPDFGGFLVKANSEGQPGPQDYGRTHADGANMMAEALAPFDGVVMWRAFVYSDEEPDDRAKQAYNEFKPLDGTFRENVLIQVKNGPIDFQPREPFHPLFGAMPETPLMMEFQITQEYLGQATQLVYLAPMWKECLDSDTYAKGNGSEVSKVINGALHGNSKTGIAGVANIGTDINWTGHPMAQSNWYAYGRLAWDTSLSSESIAKDWVRMTYGSNSEVVKTITSILMKSWEASVSYMTPLGLHHLMATGHHYGPGPWVSNLSRADWNPVYYHRADSVGIGFDRTTSGANAVGQYFPEVAEEFGSLGKCPDKFLLWFHHVPWSYQMRSGKSLWNELASKYQEGIDEVRTMQHDWKSLSGKIDEQRFEQVDMLLTIQEKEAVWWKDASMLYFQTFSNRPFPDFMEKPRFSLDYYQSQSFPFAPGIRPRW